MGLKILHSADWHMGSPFSGFTPEQRTYLRQEQRKIPGKIADLVRRENCDLVLLSGDIFDSPEGGDDYRIVRDALEGCGVPVFIAPGNHDYLTPGSVWEKGWPENVHIFREGISSVVLKEADCRIWGAGYRSMDCPGLLAQFRAEGEEPYQLAVLHGDPMRLRSPYCPVTTAQVRDSGLSYLALGHIHKAGSFRTPRTLCGWPGAPMGRGYDETREKGVYIIELGDRAEQQFIPLDTPEFYDLEANMDTQSPEELLPPAASDHFYRVTLTGSGGEPLWELKRRYGYLKNLEFVDRRVKQTDIWERADEDTLEGIYFRLLREKQSDADPELNRCVALAAEISQKILEGREVVL